MAGALPARHAALLYLAGWLMLGLLFAGLMVSGTQAGWGAATLMAVPVTLVYGCAAGFSTFYLCRAYPLGGRHPAAIMLVFAVSAAMCAALWLLLCTLWSSLWPQAGVGLTLPMKYSVWGLGFILYCMLAVAHYLAIEFQKARAAERRGLEAQLAAQEAELRMLRTQIDPHFLFNSLNSISALTSQDPARARDMTLQLAGFFRHSLGLEAHRKVTLDAEIRLVTQFLAIEKVRFGARLQFDTDLGPGSGECLLPPMVLQPLVENAVKHGIGSLPDGGTLRVTASRTGSQLHILVENDVDRDLPHAPGKGIGLDNVRQRLATLYAHEASVNWTRSETAFRVALTLPAETEEQ